MLATRMRMSTGYDVDAQALFEAWATDPGAARKVIVNQFFLDLKAAGVFAGLDEFWLLAGHDSTDALLGGKRYKDCTAVNAPVFTVDQGYLGATSKYLNSNFTPSTDGVQYTLNSASMGIYSRTESSIETNDMGAYKTTATVDLSTLALRNAGNFFGPLNDPVGGWTNPNASSLGLFAANRSGAGVGATELYKNGAAMTPGGVAAGILNPFPFFILLLSRDGSPDPSPGRQHAFAFVGRSFNATEHADLFTAVETYMDAIGAGVVA